MSGTPESCFSSLSELLRAISALAVAHSATCAVSGI